MSLATSRTTAHTIPISPLSVLARSSTVALKTTCSSCHLRELCVPCGLSSQETERLDSLNFSRRKVTAGQSLYRQGERFHFIYAVRSGTFKSGLTLADGREQVSGFHMAGELMGLDGLAGGAYASAASALEDSEICAIPYAHLNELSGTSSNLQNVIGRMMSREIVREHTLMVLLGSMNAQERLATFLLNLSHRLQARGYSATEFHLRMSRAEIGSYLGLQLETVSRTFSAFQQEGVLEVDKRHIRILDPQALVRAFESRVH
jgi:CRP/FNR family transcriptional regulator